MPMVNKQEIANRFLDYFQICPICRSKSHYKISGLISLEAKCNACDARWTLITKKDNQIESLILTKIARKGGGYHVFRKKLSIDYWQNKYDPTIGKCPECNTDLVWICPKCKTKVAMDSNCPNCNKEIPVTINCPKCSNKLFIDNGKLHVFTKEKEKELYPDGVPMESHQIQALNSSIDILINSGPSGNRMAFDRLLGSELLGGNTWGVKRSLQNEEDRKHLERIANKTIDELYVQFPKIVSKKLQEKGLFSLLNSLSNKCLNCGELIPKISKGCLYCGEKFGKVTTKEKKDDPLEILKIRFAKGEINLEEYEKMKKILE